MSTGDTLATTMTETMEERAARELGLLNEDLYRLWLRYGTEGMPKLVRAAPYRFGRWRTYVLDDWRRYTPDSLAQRMMTDRIMLSLDMGTITLVRDDTLHGEQYVIDWESSWDARRQWRPGPATHLMPNAPMRNEVVRPLRVVELIEHGELVQPETVTYRVSYGSQSQILRIAESIFRDMDDRQRSAFISERVERLMRLMEREEHYYAERAHYGHLPLRAYTPAGRGGGAQPRD